MGLRESFTKTFGMRIVDIFRKTKMCKIIEELYETEYADIRKLEEIQLIKMRKLLIHCKQHVPYYRKLFSDYEIYPEKMCSLTDIQCLPILTKDKVRKQFPELMAENIEEYRPRIKETGGSTGQPLRIYFDEVSHGTLWAHFYRGFGFGGYKLGEKYATLAYGSLTPKKLNFRMPVYFWLQNTVTFPSFQIEQGFLDEILNLLRVKKPKYIYGYSSVITQLARYLDEKNQSISGLKAIFTTADMLYFEERNLIQERLMASVYDNYGCPEAGVMTNECAEHDGYHYNMESCYIEIVDKDANGVGRVTATNLNNYAFPTIRYDTGDIGKLGIPATCICGRSHTKIESLVGRSRDVITLPDGRAVHGAFFNHLPAFYNNNDISRYQIVQTQPDKIEVHLQMATNKKIGEVSYIVDLLRDVFKEQVEVCIVEGAFRESSISKKHRTVISEVDNIWNKNTPRWRKS